MSRIAGRFTRVESRRRARKLVLGLLSDLPRKNCWTIAEWAGDRTPDGMQRCSVRRFIAVSFSFAAAMLSSRPAISPSQPCCLASAMRAWRLSMISRRRGACAGSGRRAGHRMQASLNLRR